MLWFWGAMGAVLALVLIGAWIYDRRSGGLDMTDRDRAGYDRAQADQSHAHRDVQAGNWGGFNQDGGFL